MDEGLKKKWIDRIQKAYKHYNKSLFDSCLPENPISINSRLRTTLAQTYDTDICFAEWYLEMHDISDYSIRERGHIINRILIHEMIHVEQARARTYRRWEEAYGVKVKGRGWHGAYFKKRCKDLGLPNEMSYSYVDEC